MSRLTFLIINSIILNCMTNLLSIKLKFFYKNFWFLIILVEFSSMNYLLMLRSQFPKSKKDIFLIIHFKHCLKNYSKLCVFYFKI